MFLTTCVDEVMVSSSSANESCNAASALVGDWKAYTDALVLAFEVCEEMRLCLADGNGV